MKRTVGPITLCISGRQFQPNSICRSQYQLNQSLHCLWWLDRFDSELPQNMRKHYFFFQHRKFLSCRYYLKNYAIILKCTDAVSGPSRKRTKGKRMSCFDVFRQKSVGIELQRIREPFGIPMQHQWYHSDLCSNGNFYAIFK